MKHWSPLVLVAIALVAAPALGQVCATQATVGNFEYTFEGAVFDGIGTEFSYCVTGLGGDGFRALSNWELELDTECVQPDNLLACSPEPCFYQEDDPHTAITGIKFDDVEVEAGETECFSFTLEGDWTDLIGAVDVGLKAAKDVVFGSICGPVCVACNIIIEVPVIDGVPHPAVQLIHNRPPTVVTPVVYEVYQRIQNSAPVLVFSWTDGPITLALGQPYEYSGPIPGLPALESGRYRLTVRMEGMSGWRTRSALFQVP